VHYYGEIMALLTAFCWAYNSVVFADAGKRVSSLTVNRMRLYIAFFSLLIFHSLCFGEMFPLFCDSRTYFYLALSGVIGYVLGDSFLFESFLMIGPRLSMLIMTSSPVFSTILAMIFLKEHLSISQIVAIFITISGIGWVVSEKNSEDKNKRNKKIFLGVLFAVIGSISQSAGLLFSKLGLESGISSISANFIRVSAGMSFVLLYSIIGKKLAKDIRKMKNKRALIEIGSGTILGPVIGVIFSLEAINHTSIGIASTLMSLSPVILIPVSYYHYKEKITWRSIFGTLLAVFGASYLFFS